MNKEQYRIAVVSGTAVNAENRVCRAAYLREVLEEADPDFLLLNGDIADAPKSASELQENLSVMLVPVIHANVPWAHVYGERDLENLTEEQQREVYASFPGCHSFVYMFDDTDYCVPLEKQEKGTPFVLLWCIDTHREIGDYENAFHSPGHARLPNTLYGRYYMDGIRYGQTYAYRRASVAAEEKYGRQISGIVFAHTPLPEHAMVPMNAVQTGMTGEQSEPVRCSVVNGGFFACAAERHDIRAIVSSHGGKNGFSGVYCGVQLIVAPGCGTGKYTILNVLPEKGIVATEIITLKNTENKKVCKV